ncbi:uncharacterized protein [Anoplolepis gracilipes]|uniref:uncharacterized protein isoform X2 n=1 Tax=Anoplolepis gracilipes TaxID=354296 RepID=UPI003B9E24D7
MAYSQMLRSDLQVLLDKYREIRDKFSALYVFSEMQQRSLECEREKLETMKNKEKKMLRWLMNREKQYKISLDHLEKENEKLHCMLIATQREQEHDKFLNNDKVSKLQDEIDFLRGKVVQLESKHKQQLMSQDKRHEDEILKYKRLLDETKKKKERYSSIYKPQNVASKKIHGMENRLWNTNHPALINDENMEKMKKPGAKLPPLEIVKIVHKRRKLFHKDDETVVDVI